MNGGVCALALGGKKKPLKAPKKQVQDMDEVCDCVPLLSNTLAPVPSHRKTLLTNRSSERKKRRWPKPKQEPHRKAQWVWLCRT